jgi:uroporphyrinogen III methyltransferase/synthase
MPGAFAAPVRRMNPWWVLVVVLVLAIAGGFWWLQLRVEHLTQELARRQQSNDALVQETRVLSRDAQETVKDLQGKVGALDGQVTETRDKQVALEQVYQDLMRNRDDWEIAEIQQLLTNAGQQLQLTGSVQVALAALQSADARLARADKPQYNQLRRAIARDIGRMKAVPDTDLTGAAIKLDEAINQIDALPLLSGERMLDRTPGEGDRPAQGATKGASTPAAASAASGNVVSRLWTYVVDELGQVIRVRKVDDTNALLLSGDQGWFLRENVKLRLLNARLALLSRNEPVFRNDLAAAQAMIARYCDTRSRRVQGVLTLLKQAQASAVTVSLPTMAESLGALRALKKE